MKKIILALAFIFIYTIASAQDSSSVFSIPLKTWNLKIISNEHLYPIYLADPLDVRFDLSVRNMKYSDIDQEDKVNQDGTYIGRFAINSGARMNLFKFSPNSNPNLGVSLTIGVMTPVFMRSGNYDVVGIDGIYYLAITGRPYEWLSLRASKHHICTHVGDEFPTAHVNSPIDFDPNIAQLPIRDDYTLGFALKPLYFLNKPQWNILQIYGEFGFFLPGSDLLGERQIKPNATAYLHYQGGVELEYYFPINYLGGLFAATNVSAYQLNAYAPNISVVWGYILPQQISDKRLRVGFQYYNGRSTSNHFYNRKEKFTAFYVAVDF